MAACLVPGVMAKCAHARGPLFWYRDIHLLASGGITELQVSYTYNAFCKMCCALVARLRDAQGLL